MADGTRRTARAPAVRRLYALDEVVEMFQDADSDDEDILGPTLDSDWEESLSEAVISELEEQETEEEEKDEEGGSSVTYQPGLHKPTTAGSD